MPVDNTESLRKVVLRILKKFPDELYYEVEEWWVFKPVHAASRYALIQASQFADDGGAIMVIAHKETLAMHVFFDDTGKVRRPNDKDEDIMEWLYGMETLTPAFYQYFFDQEELWKVIALNEDLDETELVNIFGEDASTQIGVFDVDDEHLLALAVGLGVHPGEIAENGRSWDLYGYTHGNDAYLIGTESQVDSSALTCEKDRLEDSPGEYSDYLERFIDEDQLVEYLSSDIEDMVRDHPEGYIHEEKGGEERERLQSEIDDLETEIGELEDEIGELDENDDADELEVLNTQMELLEERKSSLESEMEDLEYTDEQIEAAVDDYKDGIRRDVMGYLKNDLGYDSAGIYKYYGQFIDFEKAAEESVSSQGNKGVFGGTIEEVRFRVEDYQYFKW